MSDTPLPIELTFERILCPRHGEPFRESWPLGFTVLAIKGLHILLMKQEFMDEAWKLTPNEGKIPVKIIETLLNTKPLCCRLQHTELLECYLDSGIGRLSTCENCGERATGTRYRLRNHWGRETVKNHLCFTCVLERIEKR